MCAGRCREPRRKGTRVAAPSGCVVPWAARASCWPQPQQLLPVSAAGSGRRCCTGAFPRRTIRRVLRVALAAFSAAPWQGFEKSERGPSLGSLFPPQAAVASAAGCSIPARVTFYARHLLKSVYKEKSTTSNEVVLFGDPYGNRTSIILQISFNAIRTNDNFITGMDFIKGYFYICVVQSVVLFI